MTRSKIKSLLKRNKSVIENLSYVSILQLFNMLVPLLVYPYLIRVLGKETYGVVIFAQAVVGYFIILVGFGFNITATKEISIYRDNKEKINEIFSNVFILKGVLFLSCVIIFYFVLSFIPEAKEYSSLFYLTLYLCLYEWLFPVWYFQGIEEMKYITILNVVSRGVFFILIFIFIKNKNDYLLYPIISGIGAIIASILALMILFFKYQIRFVKPTIRTLKFYLSDSFPVFLSTLSAQIFAGSNKVIIGSFFGMTDVAYYDLAEKLVNLLRLPQALITQVLFPKISKDKDVYFVKRIFKISIIGNLITYALLFIFNKPIIILLGGEDMLNASPIVSVLALIAPLTVFTTVFGTQLLLAFGYNKEFSKVVISAAFFYFIFMGGLFLSSYFTIVMITWLTVVTIVFESVYMYYFLIKVGLMKSVFSKV